MAFRGDRGGKGRGSPEAYRGGRGGRGGQRGFSRGGAPLGGVFSPLGATSSIDTRLSDGSDTALVQSFRNLTLQPQILPLRPDFGSVGTQIKLRANFFPVKVPNGPLFEYDVAISPTAGTTNQRVKRRIFHLAEQSPDWARQGLTGIVAHDHSAKLIAAKKLPQPLTIRVHFYDEDENTQSPKAKDYILTVTFIQNLDTSSLLSYLAGHPQYSGYDILPVIAALNIILAAHPNRTDPSGGVLVGRNRFFFPSASPPTPLGGGLEAWRGFYSSVRPSHKQLMVNVNVCTTAFYTAGNLADAMMSYRTHSFGARYSAFAQKVRVKTLHLGHKKTVHGVSDLTPKQHRFRCEEFGNAEVTVETFFTRKYNIKLRHPELPLVDLGNQRKSVLVPPELCEILPNQPFKGKLSDENTAAMITVAAKPPNINAAAIVGPGLDELGFRQGVNPLGSFGVSIGTEMTVVPGRILPPPVIKYGRGTPRVDDRASWNLRDVEFTQGATLQNWAVLMIQDNNPRDEFRSPTDPELRSTVNGFIDMCRKCGIKVAPDDPHYIATSIPPKDSRDPTRAKAVATIRSSLQTIPRKPTFILVILSNGDKHVYNGLKHLCDSYLDVATVCVHSSKIRKEKGQQQYFASVALKVNMKLGGVNHALDVKNMTWLLQTPTMLVGIDVTHPGPGTVPGTPSIAAVVASIDRNYAQYPASMELQESKKEMVTNLDGMMVERLNLFKAKNKCLPQRILVYRDGVSEGQFRIVVDQELPLIRAACTKFDTAQTKYSPKLTIVICGKRHHARFYPTEAANADQNGNPKAGTVVDRGVTAVYGFDFFLQAHGGLQGTTKPTHYHVVHDDIKFTADELQGLTNSVSYLFSRATKAVSLACPAYYADLACERGRCFIHKLLQGTTAVNLKAQSAGEKVMEEARNLWHNGVQGVQLRNTMYYL